MKDLMIDIETLGTSNNCVVTQIGACYFDRYTGEIGSEFEVNISINDSLRHGFEVDWGALGFWFNQIYETDRIPSWCVNQVTVNKAKEHFREFAKDSKYVWSHATFDAVRVANIYHKFGEKPPFHYRAVRDIRTLVDLAGIKDEKIRQERVDAHDALADCKYQVKYCVLSLNKLHMDQTQRNDYCNALELILEMPTVNPDAHTKDKIAASALGKR